MVAEDVIAALTEDLLPRVADLDIPRTPGQWAATLYIGLGRGGQILEVLAVLTPPRDVFVFHAMSLRPEIAQRAGLYDEEE